MSEALLRPFSPLFRFFRNLFTFPAVAMSGDEMMAAASWLKDADAILVCSGAGMSLKDGEKVYVNREDFNRWYPWMSQWGYGTCYEAMGMFMDSRVPPAAKWGFWMKHYDNMGKNWAPGEVYSVLKEVLEGKDYFCYTSNADKCFERSGLDPMKVYNPQGNLKYYQCMGKRSMMEGPCRPDSIFEVDYSAIERMDERGFLQEADVPYCKNCGSKNVFMNLRASGGFIHLREDDAARRFLAWGEEMMKQKKKVAVVEIGAGFNSPIVTRYPMEAFTREGTPNGGSLIRINPSDNDVPTDLPRALGLPVGGEALKELLRLGRETPAEELKAAADNVQAAREARRGSAGRFASLDWRQCVEQLMRPPC